MANKLDFMDLKQILRLKIDGLSNRKISENLQISRNTVNRYVAHFESLDFDLGALLVLDDARFCALFPSHTTIKNPRYDRLVKHLAKVHEARQHPGFTFQLHYLEYADLQDDAYSYTQFMEHYHRIYPKEKGSMKLNHVAGEKMFIDFAGKKLQIVDRKTGEISDVEVFVAILPHSQFTYVEACKSQKREDMLACIANAMAFFGGVPKVIVSDNLKSAVTRASKYEPVINRSFKDFARHYNCAISPTRAYAPQDKALVENAVQLSYQRIYHPLRNITFFSLKELNQAIGPLLDRYNDQLFTRRDCSRKELFQSVERQYLKALPPSAFEMKDYKRAKVQKIGHVYFSPDKSYYSVPYRYIGKHTRIHYTKSTVEIYYNHERIACFERNREKGIYNTQKEHLRSTHNAYLDWSPDYFKKMAAKQGEYVLRLIDGVFSENYYPETQYKRAQGIIQLNKQYGSQRLNKACKKAVELEHYSYHYVCNILKNKQEDCPTAQANDQSHIPEHENIRGANAFV